MALSPRVPELPRPLLIGVARFLASAGTARATSLTAVGIGIESDVTEHTIDRSRRQRYDVRSQFDVCKVAKEGKERGGEERSALTALASPRACLAIWPPSI